MESTKKELVVRVDPAIREPQKCDLSLVRYDSEDGILLQFATRSETETEIIVNVKSVVELKKEAMAGLFFRLFDVLEKYEDEYHNGYGISLSSEGESGEDNQEV